MQALPDGVESRDAREADELMPPGAIPPKAIVHMLRQRTIASNKKNAGSLHKSHAEASGVFEFIISSRAA